MWRIIKENTEVGMTENPNYIKLQDNGVYALCDEQNAQGIVYNDTIYHVWGKPEIPRPSIVSVALIEIDGGAQISAQAAISSIAFVAAAETGGISESAASAHADAFPVWTASSWRELRQGSIRQHDGKLWRFLLASLSDASQNREPGSAGSAAIWVEIAYRNGVRVIPDTFTSTNAFYLGEHGYWHGSAAAPEGVYRSGMDGNTTLPGTINAPWTLVSSIDAPTGEGGDQPTEPEPVNEWPDWTPGTYAKNAQVTRNGKHYISQVDGNHWEPGAAGVYDNIWKLVP